MSAALTAKTVENIQPDDQKRREISDARQPGLWLVVQPSGRKSWAFRYRFKKRTRKLTLGSYPLVSLAEARFAAAEAAKLIDVGVDPSKEQQKRSDRNRVTNLVDEFDKRHLTKLKSSRAAFRYLERFVLPVWGDWEITDISKRDVIDLLEAIVDSGTPVQANRALAHVRKFLNWCVERDILEKSPAAGVKPPHREVSRDRVLSDQEIVWLWRACKNIGYPFGPLAQVLLLTGQRLGEVSGIVAGEIEGEIWRLPPERTKNGREHTVPLSTEVTAISTALTPPIGPKGLYFTTSGITPVSGYSRAMTRLKKAMEVEAGQPIEHWTFHDLRRTMVSGMARMGVPIHVVEAVINHKSGTVSGVAAVYNRYDYAEEKADALKGWGEFVGGLLGG